MNDNAQSENEKSANSFLDNYRTLEACANELSEQKEPDVDAIIPLVEKSVSAYNQCIERITAVEAMLEKFEQPQN
jgi:exodeoxyribonuclease VII small subunit